MGKYLLWSLAFAAIGTGTLTADDDKKSRPQTSKPNVVVILADDMGYGDVSSYNPHSKIHTPNIDRIGSEGVQFTDAHSGGSSCIPSRYALMTGRFATGRSMSLAGGPLIKQNQLTVPSLMQKQGYVTAMVGKWHLGFSPYLQDANKPVDYSQPLRGGPVDCGFDSFFGMHASLDIPPYFYIRDRQPVTPPTAEIEAHDNVGGPEGWNNIQGAFWRKGKISPDLHLNEVTPRFFAEAESVIKKHGNDGGGKPLFLYLALPSPHTPWLPAEAFRGKSKAGMYGDFVVQVDAGVGQILVALKAAGMDDNTLVLFSSDNGPVWYDKDRERFGHDSVGGLRGMKFSSYEGGHRMPFLARWPRRIPPGKICRRTIAFSDLLSTMAALTEADPLPREYAAESVNFLPLLLSPEKGDFSRPPIIHDRKTIRDGDWKLILPGKSHRSPPRITAQLYNITSDPTETDDLFSQQSKVAERLRKRLSSFLSQQKK